MIHLPPDFSEFLQLLNSEQVEYLVIGGFAVGHYGYVRATGDIDVWIARSEQNAGRVIKALRRFGFREMEIAPDLFLKENQIARMGVSPIRIELLTTISGVQFAECYAQRTMAVIDGVDLPFISLEHLKINKKASGRSKDLVDLDNLP